MKLIRISLLSITATIILVFSISLQADEYKNTRNLKFLNSVKDSADKRDKSIRNPYKSGYTISPQEKITDFSDKNHAKNIFSNYYIQLSNVLNSKTGYNLSKEIHDNFWKDYSLSKRNQYIKRLRLIIGYHDLLPKKFQLVRKEVDAPKDSHAKYIIERLIIKGRVKSDFIVYKCTPKFEPIGTLVAIHGGDSNPEQVMGMYKLEDYMRSVGLKYCQKGYVVYAPQVDWEDRLDLDMLAYSSYGGDLAKLEDLIEFILSEDLKHPLITTGASYGSVLADFLGIINDNVDAVVSTAGVSRADYLSAIRLGKIKSDWRKKEQYSYVPSATNLLFVGSMLKLLATKYLVISNGIADNPYKLDGKSFFSSIDRVFEFYRKEGFQDRIKTNLFIGNHEMDPEGEIESLQKLFKDKK